MALDFLAGCIGGSAGVLIGHPLDTVKVCIQTQDSNNPRYRGTLHCLQSICTQQGFKGIYRGVTSPLFGVAGINAIVFGIYGNTQRHMQNPDLLISHAIAGGTAGLVQSFICSPIELAKSTMQVGNTSHQNPLDCLKSIYQKNGLKGVYRGLNITILREIPAFGSYFMAYELLTRRNDDLPVSTCTMLWAGGLAGVISWILIYPIDVIKSRFQLEPSLYKSSYDCLTKSVNSEGVSCLFRGLLPTVIRAFPVNAVTFTVVTWTMKLLDDIRFPQSLKRPENPLGKYADAVMIGSAEHLLMTVL
ncbi:mitochondrial basic amino acids transporter [Dendroctonus ponderosae]|nr:mitochondrial basic amino acids transporter [Dendroctonus ponderosae]